MSSCNLEMGVASRHMLIGELQKEMKLQMKRRVFWLRRWPDALSKGTSDRRGRKERMEEMSTGHLSSRSLSAR